MRMCGRAMIQEDDMGRGKKMTGIDTLYNLKRQRNGIHHEIRCHPVLASMFSELDVAYLTLHHLIQTRKVKELCVPRLTTIAQFAERSVT